MRSTQVRNSLPLSPFKLLRFYSQVLASARAYKLPCEVCAVTFGTAKQGVRDLFQHYTEFAASNCRLIAFAAMKQFKATVHADIRLFLFHVVSPQKKTVEVT